MPIRRLQSNDANSAGNHHTSQFCADVVRLRIHTISVDALKEYITLLGENRFRNVLQSIQPFQVIDRKSRFTEVPPLNIWLHTRAYSGFGYLGSRPDIGEVRQPSPLNRPSKELIQPRDVDISSRQ